MIVQEARYAISVMIFICKTSFHCKSKSKGEGLMLCDEGKRASKASDSPDDTSHWKEGFHPKDIAWLIYGMDAAVLEKDLSTASKALNKLQTAFKGTTSLQGCCGVSARFSLALKQDGELVSHRRFKLGQDRRIRYVYLTLSPIKHNRRRVCWF